MAIRPTFENTGAGSGRSSQSGQASMSSADQVEIISDQDQTSIHADPQDDLRGGGPANLDLEDEPDEFLRGEIDVKTQMDRTTRIAKADAFGHHDLDDSPDMTPGGVEEVAAKTDEELARRGHGRPVRTAVRLEDPGFTRRSAQLDIDKLEEEVDLTAQAEFAVGEMNEKDAREAGYLDHNKGSQKPAPLHSEERGSPTGAYTDIGAGRSSVVKHRPH